MSSKTQGGKTPFVSIVVPVRNTERTIETCIKNLTAVAYSNYEIVFGDGGSTDRTPTIIEDWQKKDPRIKLVRVPNCPNPGTARNAAIDIAKGEIIAFTDGDCAPAVDWLDKIVEAFQLDPKIGGVGGNVFTLRTREKCFAEQFSEDFHMLGYFGESRYLKEYDLASQFITTCTAAYRKEALQDAAKVLSKRTNVTEKEKRFWEEFPFTQYFNPWFLTGEDHDLFARVQKAGWKCYYRKEATVKHMHRTTKKAVLRQWYWYGDARPHLLVEHFPKHLRIRFFSRTLLGRFPIHAYINFDAYHLLLVSLILLALSTVKNLVFPELFANITWFPWLSLYLTYSILGIGLLTPWSATLLALIVYSFNRHLKRFIHIKSKKRRVADALFLFLMNTAFVLGGLRGCLRYGSFTVSESLV